jgi:MFS family permease
MHSDTSSAGPSRTAPGATHALILLVLINLFNFIDRQVLAAVEPYVRAEFFPPVLNPETGRMEEPEHAKAAMGWLAFAFLATYIALAPVFGALATRVSRWWLIAGGVVVWSLASGASGASEWLGQSLGGRTVTLFATTLPMAYAVMLLTRALVGVGEAVYGPVAPDILSDLYPVERRGQVLAWFYAAIPFGGALGYALGEIVTQQTGHWSYAFYAVVPPGIALGVWCLFLKEPPRPSDRSMQHKPQWKDYLELFRVPSYTLNVAGMTFMCFTIGGLAFWAPAYLEHREVAPVFGVIPPATFFGVLTAFLGLVATLAGGWAGDALRSRYSGSYFLVSGVVMCLGAPLLVAMIYLPFPLAWVPMAAAIFCLFFNTGPTNTITANVIPAALRARGFAIAILVMHLLGDALSPTLLGAIAGKNNRFDLAFLVVAGAVLLGGLVWLWGAWYLEADTRRANATETVRATPGETVGAV